MLDPDAPGRDHGVHPLDPALGIAWPADVGARPLGKDAKAPSLTRRAVPVCDDCRALLSPQRGRSE